MIFVTVGNWKSGFDRLIMALDQLVDAKIIIDDVFAQIGPGKYIPRNFNYTDYCSPDEFDSYIYSARIIISHAGMGTIGNAIKLGKPVIVVPRKAELGEHFDNHQFATCKQLENEHKILVAYEIDTLETKINESETFIPQQNNTASGVIAAVKLFIESVIEKK